MKRYKNKSSSTAGNWKTVLDTSFYTYNQIFEAVTARNSMAKSLLFNFVEVKQ